jgi:hypothetical protein
MRVIALLIMFVVTVLVTLTATGCARLPEYVVSVQADPGVTWWAHLEVKRSLGGANWEGDFTRIPLKYDEWDRDFWEVTLEHKTERGQHARIISVSIAARKTGGEGSIRVVIMRDGEVVAQAETSQTGARASCEYAEDY